MMVDEEDKEFLFGVIHGHKHTHLCALTSNNVIQPQFSFFKKTVSVQTSILDVIYVHANRPENTFTLCKLCTIFTFTYVPYSVFYFLPHRCQNLCVY